MTTIRQRLTRRLLLGWSLLLAMGGVAAYWVARNALTRQFDEALQTRAMALSSAIEQEGGRISLDQDDSLLRDFDAGQTAFYQIWRPDGSVIARSRSLGDVNLPLHYRPTPTPQFSNVHLANGASLRAAGMRFQPHPSDDSKVQSHAVEAVLVVAADRRKLDATLNTLAGVLAGSAGLVLALTLVTLPWLLRQELAPLNRLTDQAQRITADSLSDRFPTKALPGELAPIAARLNELLQRLQTSFERERRFSDDLAHEFRTPVAELRSLAELTLKWPEAGHADTDRHVLAIALQMEAIINRLLAIARSDQDRVIVEAQHVRLADLIATIWPPLQARAAARQLVLQTTVPAELEVESDAVLSRSIVTNLLDNAVEYSLPGGTIKVQSETQNGAFSLSVTNPTEPFSALEVSCLFDRFWRKDAARSGGKHAGLGLSLARALAANMGYTLKASMSGEARLTLRLSGPIRIEKAPSSTLKLKAVLPTNHSSTS